MKTIAHNVSHALSLKYNKLKSQNICLEHCYVYDTFKECDFARITPVRHVHEYEIKCTRKDYLADFHKNHGMKHKKIENGRSGLATFTFVLIKGIVKREEVPLYCGLIEYEIDLSGRVVFEEIRKAPRLLSPRRLDDKEFFRVFKNLAYRHHLRNIKEL